MAIGTVKFFNATKGFGFISPEDGAKDVFVHISAVERAGMGTLSEGQRINYDVVSERGKLVPRRINGNNAKHQRQVALAVKRARTIALVPFTVTGK